MGSIVMIKRIYCYFKKIRAISLLGIALILVFNNKLWFSEPCMDECGLSAWVVASLLVMCCIFFFYFSRE